MKKFFEEVSDSLGSELVSGLAIALCVIMLFSIGFLTGGVSAPAKEPATDTNNTVVTTQPTAQPTTQPTTQPSTAPSTNEETPAAPEGTTAPSAEETPAPGTMSKAEIIKLYNDSANKVKTNAVKVVKNFEDREMNQETMVVPGALKGLVSTIVPKFMGDDTDPIEYATKEEIVENFIVPGQDYVSCLTEADVVEATCTDNGTEYEIMIKSIEETNPAQGKGVGAAFDVIETAEMTNNEYASMLETFDVSYSNCVLRCKIDKATGNMTWANYKTPLKMDIVVNMLGTHNVSAELSFEKDYNIFY